MGIKNLSKIIKKLAPNSITETTLHQFINKKVAIDVSLFMYKFMYANKRYIEGFYKQIMRLTRFDITPIYIFDGAPPQQKDGVLQDRKLAKQALACRISDLTDSINTATDAAVDGVIDPSITDMKTTLDKLNKRSFHINHTHYDDCIKLFQLMGIPYIKAEGEADLLCAKLCQLGLVDAAISEDMDLLPYGSKIMLRDFNIYNNNITCYNLNNILTELDMTYSQFVDLCILCGCDYSDKIHGVGPVCAYNYIKKYNDIETIIDTLYSGTNSEKLPQNFDYIRARNIFMDNSICNNICESDLVRKSANLPQVITFLSNYMKPAKITARSLHKQFAHTYVPATF